MACVGLAVALCVKAPAAQAAADPEQIVADAMAKDPAIPAQARALIELAWPKQGGGDPAVRALARQRIVEFSAFAINPLRAEFRKIPAADQEDAARALVEAFRSIPGGPNSDYPLAVEEAIWYGSEGAKRVAIPEAGRLKNRLSVLTILDAAQEFPALTSTAMKALGDIGDDRARFFLERQLQEGKGEIPGEAARALAQIGQRAVLPLKSALRSDRRSVREAAARAFIPVATLDDLSALHEYATEHPKDDPGTVRAVREVAATLEKIREAREAATAAGSDTIR